VLSGILSSAISGLTLNAQRVAAAAGNIANVSTAGYKRTDVQSKTLVIRQTSQTAYAAGGVLASPRQLSDVQGLLTPSSRPTDLAISGNGFFAVQKGATGEVLYTRDGGFAADANGNLINSSGQFLLAKASGADVLSKVNLFQAGGSAQATQNIGIGANLPSTAVAGSVFHINAQATDSLGNALDVQLNFQANAGGSYAVSVAQVTELSTGATTAVARSGSNAGPTYTHTVTFGADGLPNGSPPPTLNISGLSSGAANLNITLDLGSQGQANGLTKFGSAFVFGRVNTDGAAFGSVSGVTVGQDGTVTALFDNGQRRTIANIPVATFTSPQGLEAVSGNAFRETTASGSATLRDAGSSGAGSVQSGAVEQSNTDLGTSFATLIIARTAYSASLKVIAAGEDLARTLMNIRA